VSTATRHVRVARGGLTAAVVQDRLAGGECAFYACVSSKALLRPMELAAEVGRMPGLKLGGPIDTAPVLARRDRVVNHYDDSDAVGSIGNVPATFVRGRGRQAPGCGQHARGQTRKGQAPVKCPGGWS
jgi:dihydrolipoamide dehydrogenase